MQQIIKLRLGIVLTLFLTVLGGCAAKAQVVPIQEEILLPRADGCTGPAGLNDYILVPKDLLKEAETLLMWCSQEHLLPEGKRIELKFVPENLECGSIPNAVLNEFFMLIKKGDFVYMNEQLEECAANYDERQQQKNQANEVGPSRVK